MLILFTHFLEIAGAFQHCHHGNGTSQFRYRKREREASQFTTELVNDALSNEDYGRDLRRGGRGGEGADSALRCTSWHMDECISCTHTPNAPPPWLHKLLPHPCIGGHSDRTTLQGCCERDCSHAQEDFFLVQIISWLWCKKWLWCKIFKLFHLLAH